VQISRLTTALNLHAQYSSVMRKLSGMVAAVVCVCVCVCKVASKVIAYSAPLVPGYKHVDAGRAFLYMFEFIIHTFLLCFARIDSS
jgi:hypothetical protein